MLDCAQRQVIAYPLRAVPLEPAPLAVGVARNLDDLRSAAGNELTDGYAHVAAMLDQVGREVVAAVVLEPIAAADEV